MVEIIRIKGGTDNCYLITDGEDSILVDTASKGSLDKVIAECDKHKTYGKQKVRKNSGR